MRPIDADRLYNSLRRLCDETDCNIAIMPDVMGAVRDAPTVDAEPVRHEHWEVSLDGDTFCSGCSTEHRLTGRIPKYCPNCGAKMDERQTIKTIEQEEKQCTP